MVVDWHWHFGVPTIALWTILAALVVIPKHNRNLATLAILIMPAISAALAVLMGSMSGIFTSFEPMFQFITAFAIAWSVVWLLGPWLPSGSRIQTSFFSFVTMLVIGGLAYYSYFGAGVTDDTVPLTALWLAGCATLVLSTAFTGWCCRNICTAWQIILWPILWLPLVAVFATTAFFFTMVAVAGAPAPNDFGEIAAGFMMATAVISGALYALNLPVTLLTAFNSIYRERFRKRYCPESADGAVVFVPPLPDRPSTGTRVHDGNPFGF